MASQLANVLTGIPAIPAVVTRTHDIQKFVAALQRRLSGIPRARYLSFLKLCAFLVLLVNAGSLPFAWHLRVFWPIIVTRIQFLLLRTRLLFKSSAERKRILAERVEAHCPIGANPFEFVTVYRRWASIDDADMFGMHLSNSSYAKALDSARLRVLWRAFPAWGISGGTLALGATHYHFIREIPLFARYEVRISIASWDNKWMYVIARYVTRPKGHRAIKAGTTMTNGHVTLPSDTPADVDSKTGSPQLNGTLTPNSSVTDMDNLERTVADVLATSRTPTRRLVLEPDGSLLHCIAVSQMCFKQGRISVPPAVALASEGFSNPPSCLESNGSHELPARYTPSNPPPHWAKVREIRVPPSGSMEHFKEFLKNGWKEVPDSNGHAEGADGEKLDVGGKWWEEALGGPIEEKRKNNLEIVETLRVGMERIRGSYHSLEG
ncbi:hypothetical protein SCLCIDRAFT_322128 [Scleroderma citrinum Foug A]|uniref:Thioesterase domain-containing protein n=1 Tax=Scleroderma citrinum Foug A TaxID=1036808 RepID=A0A0C3E0W5_9AGAM|nr:hypothetical protein SCLCIDRAFT_322128 [Scleroderma citrinum Foug A]